MKVAYGRKKNGIGKPFLRLKSRSRATTFTFAFLLFTFTFALPLACCLLNQFALIYVANNFGRFPFSFRIKSRDLERALDQFGGRGRGYNGDATLESASSLLIQILVVMLSVSASVLAGVQTLLNFAERSDRHRAAALKYGVLRRRIEVALATGPGENTTLRDFAEAFRGEWDAVDKEAPVLPQRFFNAASNQVVRSMEAARRRKEKEENGGAGS